MENNAHVSYITRSVMATETAAMTRPELRRLSFREAANAMENNAHVSYITRSVMATETSAVTKPRTAT